MRLMSVDSSNNFHEAPDPEAYAGTHRRVSRVVRTLWHLDIINPEYLPVDGSYIYMPTHRSLLDPFIAGIIPQRAIYFMAKKELWEQFQYRPLRRYFERRGGFPVDRHGYPRQALEAGRQVIADDHALCMFAEGTSRNRGLVDPEDLKGGVAALAIWAASEGIDCPVVPVGLDSQWLVPGKAVTAVVGEPQYPELGGRKKDVRGKFSVVLASELQANHLRAIKHGQDHHLLNRLINSH